MKKSNFDEYSENRDTLYLNLWDEFDDPEAITNQEKKSALAFLKFLNIDIEDEKLIVINTRPTDLANMFVSFQRKG